MCNTLWEECRADVLASAKIKNESIIKTWLNKIGYTNKNTIGYNVSLSDKTIEIYTTHPGALIGKAGINVDELKKILSNEIGGEWNIQFIEIRSGFVMA